MNPPKFLPLALFGLLLSLPASALEIAGPWARATPPGSTLSAAFMTLDNGDGPADRLLDASSPGAGRVEIHETRQIGDVMQMRQLEQGLEVGAGSRIEMAPGGLHLMLLDLPAPLVAGESLTLNLRFEHTGDIQITVPIRAPGEQDRAAAHEHHHH